HFRQPRERAGVARRPHSGRDRRRAPRSRGRYRAEAGNLARHAVRQSADAEGRDRGARRSRHAQAPPARTGAYHSRELLVKCLCTFLLVLLLSGCSTVRLVYDNAETYLRWRTVRSEEHTSELQSRGHLVCRLLLEKKKT